MKDRFLQFLGIIKKSGSLVEGYNKCEEIINKKAIYLVIISEDCSQNTKEKFIRLCDNTNVQYVEAYTKEQLGMAIGKEQIQILGIKNKNMSDKLTALMDEQKTN